MKIKRITILLLATIVLVFSHSAFAIQVTITDVPAYGYNVLPAPDGNPGAIGCGPTSAAMILDTYTSRGATGLIGDSLVDARTMAGSAYMDVNSGGFGSPSDFHYGIEDFAADRGYELHSTLHVDATDWGPSGWAGTTYSTTGAHPDVAVDVNWWNTTAGETILVDPFLTFLAGEIDSGSPVVMTVDSSGVSSDTVLGTDHWLVGVGYDLDLGQWAGYNTWDSSIHWYDVASAWDEGNIMGIGYVRTFDFVGAIACTGAACDPDPDPCTDCPTQVPEPSTLILLGSGLIGLVSFRKKC